MSRGLRPSPSVARWTGPPPCLASSPRPVRRRERLVTLADTRQQVREVDQVLGSFCGRPDRLKRPQWVTASVRCLCARTSCSPVGDRNTLAEFRAAGIFSAAILSRVKALRQCSSARSRRKPALAAPRWSRALGSTLVPGCRGCSTAGADCRRASSGSRPPTRQVPSCH
jgi:hypothetical protein